MHTFKKSKNEPLWTVGYYEPWHDGEGLRYSWQPLADFAREKDAAAFVSYLNGGRAPEAVS